MKLLSLFFIITLILCFSILKFSFANSITTPYEIKPWQVGQYAVYQIISFEGEDAENRYRISLVGEEVIEGRKYFWEKIDIFENTNYYKFNTVVKKVQKNISFKALVPLKDATTLANSFSNFISTGIFPENPVKLAVQIGDGPWYWVDPKNFFAHQEVIENSPYSQTPHAKGRVDFSKLKINKDLEVVDSPAGKFSCFHLFVMTSAKEEYSDEGLDLWRSVNVPILGLVKMEFSKTLYWQKWAFRQRPEKKIAFLEFLRFFYKKRIAGRRRPDTCTVLLVDYGPR